VRPLIRAAAWSTSARVIMKDSWVGLVGHSSLAKPSVAPITPF
jgi:hypothetical protein